MKLASLGANRLSNRVDCDVEVDGPFSDWKADLLPRLNVVSTGQKAAATIPISGVHTKESDPELYSASTGALAPSGQRTPPSTFSRDNPLLAPLVEKKDLTHTESTKSTLHLAFSIEGTGLSYEAGDACGVVPQNDLNLVAEIIQLLRFNGNEQVPCAKAGVTTLHDALVHRLQITRLTRKMVSEYATRGKCAKLLELLVPEEQANLERYLYGRGLIDLLLEFPGVIEDPAELAAMLPKLAPRLYSISSSPAAHSGQVHTTVAVVRYSSQNRERGGVCSTLFADRVTVLTGYRSTSSRTRNSGFPRIPMHPSS